jgi:protein-disulfide isomerase
MNGYTYWAPTLTMPLDPQRDHIRGSLDAPAQLVEYGDYECPYCGAAYPIVEAVLDRLGDRVCFAYRHFPITTSHPHAETAAEAAECAAAQGRFWPMHDRLFTHQDRLAPGDLRLHAAAIGLDLPRFDTELSSSAHRERVRQDFVSGVRSGVNGTPSFFINSVRYDGSWDLDSLLASLTQAIGARAA